METNTVITNEMSDELIEVLQTIGNAIQELWNRIIEAVRAVAKFMSEWLYRISIAYRRKVLYFNLRSFHVPHILAYWIAKLMPPRFLMMW